MLPPVLLRPRIRCKIKTFHGPLSIYNGHYKKKVENLQKTMDIQVSLPFMLENVIIA